MAADPAVTVDTVSGGEVASDVKSDAASAALMSSTPEVLLVAAVGPVSTYAAKTPVAVMLRVSCADGSDAAPEGPATYVARMPAVKLSVDDAVMGGERVTIAHAMPTAPP
jgi:hypothetical protein